MCIKLQLYKESLQAAVKTTVFTRIAKSARKPKKDKAVADQPAEDAEHAEEDQEPDLIVGPEHTDLPKNSKYARIYKRGL